VACSPAALGGVDDLPGQWGGERTQAGQLGAGLAVWVEEGVDWNQQADLDVMSAAVC